MLPLEPTTVTKTIPSYLYFQYQNDTNLPSLIESYNSYTQEYLDWFNGVNLPDYTGLTGDLLDWVGAGLYGLPRPNFSYAAINPLIGAVAGAPNTYVFKNDIETTPLGLTTAVVPTVVTNIVVTDDFYKRVLTWCFYKGDGFEWSIPWFKRRIYRFMNGPNGVDLPICFTRTVSVAFVPDTFPQEVSVGIYTDDLQTGYIFAAALENGILPAPFRFTFTVTVSTLPTLVLDNPFAGLDYALLS